MSIVTESGVGREPGKDAPTVHKQASVFSRLYHGETSFRFLHRQRIFFTLSIVVILAGALSIGLRGLNFGIDFKGGTSWEVVSKSLTVTEAKTALASLGISSPVVTQLGSGAKQTIEVEADLSQYPASERTNAFYFRVSKALASAGQVPSSSVSFSSVGPTWGGEITSKAIRALIFFFLGIALYITIRFEAKMAAAALIAVLHDLLVTVGIYSIANFQITPDTVIAILTILGYSLYDTIVVFDRVQENTKALVNAGRISYFESVNLSLNQVLMRSLNTSIVAIFPVLSILVVGAYILGATTLKDFGLALFVGLTTGAYSSICIASPLLANFKEREPKLRALKERLKDQEVTAITPRAAAAGELGGALLLTPQGGTVGSPPLRRSSARKPTSKRKPGSTKR